MIIQSIQIKKFRGFNDVEFDLGKNLTIIAGQNGTQKTTLLGILTQPFTISDSSNPLYGERPLSGGNYKSLFSEKFKLSGTFDKPQSHEWTLKLTSEEQPEFTVQSIKRSSSKDDEIRFWRKGDRSKGSGYIQMPVLYLSLSRLFPIGEDAEISSSSEISLTADEFDFYQEWHNRILIIPNTKMTSADYLSSKNKNTLGANTAFYDWKMNSAGQDNIGKILLAILSFNRLKDKYGTRYNGGILAIDELDATLYPASQVKLLEALRKFSSQLKIQIIFTTHSLNILEKACEWQFDDRVAGQVLVVYLQKFDEKIRALVKLSFENIKNKLNVALSGKQTTIKIPVFTEDKECEIFFRALIKRQSKGLEFVDASMGCDNLIELARKKIRGFRPLESIIIVDGDVRKDSGKMRRVNQLDNILVLPGGMSPEQLLANLLYDLSDDSPHWEAIHAGYSKQHVFKTTSHNEILRNREKAKEWFKEQKAYWGRNSANVINIWIAENTDAVGEFLTNFQALLLRYQ
jgi:AAA15 family ATPase/GTPase